MIRRIQQIKKFGVFADFQWPTSLPEFKQFNLIYGWNYSGKTTLSRILRCFEQKQVHADFASAQVQLMDENGAFHNLFAPSTSPVFRVFNSDFIRDNLSFGLGSATPILVLGAEDIVKQELLKTKKSEQETINLADLADTIKRDDISEAIEAELSDYARDFIKKPLAEVNYDRRRFEPKVIACKDDPEKYLLDEVALRKFLDIQRSTDKKPALINIVVALSSFSQLVDKTAKLLARIVTANTPIARLKENSEVENWVNKGRAIHDGKDTCLFCGQPLPPELMDHLAKHFSVDYDNLMAGVTSLAKTIQAAQEEKIAVVYKGDLYAELQERFATEKTRLDNFISARKSALVMLENALFQKQTKAFTSLECPAVHDPVSEIESSVQAINKIISEHNSRTADFDEKRKEAFEKLEKHFAASFVRDKKYRERLQKIADLKTKSSEQNKKLAILGAEISKLELELSEASKGAERINELLGACFGKNDLRIVVSADKLFQIVRSGVVAKNLSEGEKTAIAFAYFITRIQDRRIPLADTIVVIDDPISSLDANHLFNTYALIKTQLAECRQLFISTHSFEFYNLIREWVGDDEKDTKKPQADWKKWSVFLMKRIDNGTASLEAIPKELLKFKSEYHYLFSMLYHFDKTGAHDFECLLSLPNVVRRFMEAFGGIMIPLSTGLKGKMRRIFSDEIERERVWKFINHYSHNTTITRSLSIPDTSECKAVVRGCLEAVRRWDADYFTDLEDEII